MPLRSYSNSTRAGWPGARRQRRVPAAERLQLRLLVGADHVLVGAQPAALEAALVEVEHPARPSRRSAGRGRRSRSAAATASTRRRAASARSSRPTPRSGRARSTSRCSSVREKRPSGRPCVAGNSHASAFTSATCSGGKTARAARALAILEPSQALLEEPPPPAADDIRRRLEPARDLRVGLPVGRVQDHLRPNHDLVRQRVTRHPPLQLGTLLAAQLDHERALSAPCHKIRRRRPGPFNDYRPNFGTRVLA